MGIFYSIHLIYKHPRAEDEMHSLLQEHPELYDSSGNLISSRLLTKEDCDLEGADARFDTKHIRIAEKVQKVLSERSNGFFKATSITEYPLKQVST